MKTFFLTLILLTVCQNNIFAQIDLKNWENVPWDSSEPQIKEILKEKLTLLDKPEKYSNSYCNYIIEDIQKYNSSFSVHFLMDEKSNTLDCVKLQLDPIKTGLKSKANNVNKIYESVLSLMKDEYGEPGNNEIDKYSKMSTWYFESTIIRLGFLDIEGTGLPFFTITYKKAPQGYDFREAKWGFSKNEVLESEKLTAIVDKDNIVGYESLIADLKCLIGYVFTDEKLTRARYVIQETHTNKSDYINDYKTLKSLLIKKYGATVYDNDQKWFNDLYKDDYQQWGFAISLGHLSYSSSWQTPKTNIDLILSGDNYEINLVIEYTSTQFEEVEKKRKEKEVLDKL
jgi:hypothetical protein